MSKRGDKVLLIDMPPSLNNLAEHFVEFIDIMLMKLDQNSHKKTPTMVDIPRIMDLLDGEVQEFKEQFYSDKYGRNTLVELADTSNFAFLAFVALRMQGVKNGENKNP
jgi:hypothetical protein